jgi:hypothetical protein
LSQLIPFLRDPWPSLGVSLCFVPEDEPREWEESVR